MSETTQSLATFLRVRYAEIRMLAVAATARQPYDQWDAVGAGDDSDTRRSHWSVVRIANMYPTPAAHDLAKHIAQHDPQHVLADLDSKLAIVNELAPEPGEPETDAELHARFAHPDWEYETTEGPRKRWEDQETPPYGDGWECNVDAGRDGWERFDYTEEAYWRRERTEPRAEQAEPHVLRLLSTPFAEHPDYKEAWRP